MPVISTILGIAGLAASGVGIGESVSASNKQQSAIGSQLDIAKQEEARRQAVFNQLSPFYSQYLKSGSPFLSQIQRAGAEQTATGANNAAGQIRSEMGTSGLGFGPSGATAAALGGLGAETGRTASSNYLTNLLNNEQVKFQAAQGLSGLSAGPQISPQPAQYPINPVPGAVGSLSTQLQALLKTLGSSNSPGIGPGTSGTLPTNIPGSNLPGFGLPNITPPPTLPNSAQNFGFPGGAPTTEGYAS
jgi:hypothetical protein